MSQIWDLVEIACRFLTIACDEGYSAPFVQQANHSDQAVHGDVQGLGDVQEDFGGESFRVGHECWLYRIENPSGKAASMNLTALVRLAHRKPQVFPITRWPQGGKSSDGLRPGAIRR